MPPPGASADAGREALPRRVSLTLAVGLLAPLVILGWAGAVVLAATGPDAGALALLGAAAPVATAAAVTLASAWATLAAVRRANARPSAPPQQPDPRIDIDHKVRNLLQTVVSLLSLELRRAGSTGERASLLRMQQRLQSIALAHRRSSALDAGAGVRLDLLAAEIADSLLSARHSDALAAEARLELDPLTAEPERATAFALFVNEALANALRHLDRACAGGTVTISLRVLSDGAWLLAVVNALGEGQDMAPNVGGIGRRLMTNCAEQLGATLSMERLAETYEVRLATPARPARD